MEDVFNELPSFTSARFTTMLERSGVNSVLNLTNLSITDRDVSKIVENMKLGLRLTKIWLSFNSMTENGVNELVTALLQCQIFDSLQELCLAGNRLSDNTVMYLSQAISLRNQLQILDLSNNKHITDQSALSLSRLIQTSKLKKLLLLGIGISDVGASEIANAVGPSSLEEVKLSSKLITDYTVERFCKIIKHSYLMLLVIDGKGVKSSDAMKKIQGLLTWKQSSKVKVVTILCSVHVVPRIYASSFFRMFPASLLPRLGRMMFDFAL